MLHPNLGVVREVPLQYINVRVLVYVSFPFVRSDYVISAGVGFRVASGVVASP